MNPGPLRRLVGAVGLLALAPVAVLLLLGRITPVLAAQRALVILFVVVVLGRVTTGWLHSVAHRFEADEAD